MGWDVGQKKVIRQNTEYSGNDVWQQDQANNYKIIAQRHDVHDQDLADAISDCMNLDGLTTMRANLNMGGFDITNLSPSSVVGLSDKDVASLAFNATNRNLTLTLNDTTAMVVNIPDEGGTGGGGTGTVTDIDIGEGLVGTSNPITVSGEISLAVLGVAQTFSGGIESVSIDKHGRVTQVVTGATPNTNLGLGTRTASVIPLTSSTGSGVNIPLVDKANSLAGLMSPTDKTNLDSIVASSGVTEINAGQGITVSASGTTRTVAARQASTTQIGVVELATTTEATTGTDATRAVTPAGVKAVVDAIGSMSSDAAKWDFTNSGTTMYLRYESGQLAQIPVASAGSYDGLMSAADKTNHNTMWSSALRSLTAGTGISISGTGTARTITCTVTGDTGVPAILSNGTTPSLNSGIAGSEIRSLIGAGTGNGDITSVAITAGDGLTGGGSDTSGPVAFTLNCDFGTTAGKVAEGNHSHSGYALTSHTHSQYYESGDSPTFGTVTASSFNSTSARAKKNIKQYGTNRDCIGRLKPVIYVLKNDPTGKRQLGLIADEVDPWYPEVVEYDEDGKPAGIDYSRLVIPLIEKIQELEARLEALE
jgi:hypothetical protein